MSKRSRPAKGEINIIGIPYVDMLTATVGILVLVLSIMVHDADHKSRERPLKKVEIHLPELGSVHVGENLNLQFSATGGVEPYEWSMNTNELKCGNDIKGLPEGLGFDTKLGVLKGSVLANATYPSFGVYCVGVTVRATGLPIEINNNQQLPVKRLSKNDTEQSGIFRIHIQPTPIQHSQLPVAEIGKPYHIAFKEIKNLDYLIYEPIFSDVAGKMVQETNMPIFKGNALEWNNPSVVGVLKFRIASRSPTDNEKLVFLSGGGFN